MNSGGVHAHIEVITAPGGESAECKMAPLQGAFLVSPV